MKAAFKIEKKVAENMIPLFLIPAIIYAKNLYEALIISLCAILVAIISISACYLVKKYIKTTVVLFGFSLLLCGSITSLASSVISIFKVETAQSLALAGAFVAVYSILRLVATDKNDLSYLPLITYISNRIIHFAIMLLFIGNLREMLTTGYILYGFTPDKGISVLSHNFGDYLNTLSGALLMMSVAAIGAIQLFPNRINNKKALNALPGSYKLTLLSGAVAAVNACAVCLLNKFVLARLDLEYLRLLFYFAFAALIYYALLQLKLNKQVCSVASSFSVVICVYSVFNTADIQLVLIKILISVAIFTAITFIYENACKLLYSDKLALPVRGTPALLMSAAITMLIFEQIVNNVY